MSASVWRACVGLLVCLWLAALVDTHKHKHHKHVHTSSISLSSTELADPAIRRAFQERVEANLRSMDKKAAYFDAIMAVKKANKKAKRRKAKKRGNKKADRERNAERRAQRKSARLAENEEIAVESLPEPTCDEVRCPTCDFSLTPTSATVGHCHAATAENPPCNDDGTLCTYYVVVGGASPSATSPARCQAISATSVNKDATCTKPDNTASIVCTFQFPGEEFCGDGK